MCPPDHFSIEYEINPWMKTSDQVDPAAAAKEWQSLAYIYRSLKFEVETIKPAAGLPDMVFTANGGLVIGGKVMLPRFKYPERQPETGQFKDWFEAAGFEVKLPRHDFEGEGDALVCGDLIMAGWGFRSDPAAHAELDTYFDETVVSLHLTDDRFYHLDTALAVLDHSTIAYYPGAFDANSRRQLELLIPRTIKATEAEAEGFGLNLVSDGHNVVMSDRAQTLAKQIEALGYKVHTTPIKEFQKSGGGVKCLTLELRT